MIAAGRKFEAARGRALHPIRLAAFILTSKLKRLTAMLDTASTAQRVIYEKSNCVSTTLRFTDLMYLTTAGCLFRQQTVQCHWPSARLP